MNDINENDKESRENCSESEKYMGWNKFKDIDEEFHKNISELLKLDIPKIDLIHHFPAYIGHVNLARYFIFYDLYKKCCNLTGHIADVGTWKGSSFLFMSKLVRLFETFDSTQVHGFDWFEGLEIGEQDYKFDEEFKNRYKSEYKLLLKLIKLQKLNDIAILHKMDVTKELNVFFKKHPYMRFKMVFIDCAIKKVLEKSLENFWPRIVKGGILIIDHYNVEVSPSESEIVEKFVGNNYIRQFPFNRQPTAYIIKEQ